MCTGSELSVAGFVRFIAGLDGVLGRYTDLGWEQPHLGHDAEAIAHHFEEILPLRERDELQGVEEALICSPTDAALPFEDEEVSGTRRTSERRTWLVSVHGYAVVPGRQVLRRSAFSVRGPSWSGFHVATSIDGIASE